VENQVTVAEIWSFHSLADQTRFTLVQKSSENAGPAAPERAAARRADPKRPAPPARKASAARKPAAKAAPRKKAAPAKKAARPAKRK
jgi:hypothetical protein